MNTELAVRFGRHFITAGCLWLDLGWGSRAVYASAGHLPVCVRRRRKNRTEEIISYGKLLGWPDQFSVKPTQTKIESGDRVLMYTDGLIEARNNDGQLFGFARLYETLALADALPVEEAADAVLRAVYDWVGSEDELEDDMTLVMVDIT
ncbi:MAG: serine/threonine-protein phosphatase [Spirochaetia bacterium]|nr:serine/threonine-protein phosphatase [Spirochaetia bacterium]